MGFPCASCLEMHVTPSPSVTSPKQCFTGHSVGGAAGNKHIGGKEVGGRRPQSGTPTRTAVAAASAAPCVQITARWLRAADECADCAARAPGLPDGAAGHIPGLPAHALPCTLPVRGRSATKDLRRQESRSGGSSCISLEKELCHRRAKGPADCGAEAQRVRNK